MTEHIISRVTGRLGHITLNRPKALNALSHQMNTVLMQTLLGWREDPAVSAVLIDGAGEKAFCAGGDVVSLHDSGKAKDGMAERFWRTEYALCALIAEYPKPYISLMDGYVMGGGAGLSMHGRFRIAAEQTLFAMPETAIGYFPDVGASYVLPRLKHPNGQGHATPELGMWMALTGARLTAGQACTLGICNAYILNANHVVLIKALANLNEKSGEVMDIMTRLAVPAPKSDLPSLAALVPFREHAIEGVFEALKYSGTDWAREQLSILTQRSPIALKATHTLFHTSIDLSLREALRLELSLTLGFLSVQDFYEGIRAQLIDKDRNPKWSHEFVSAVSAGQIERLFRCANPPLAFHNTNH